VPVALPVVCRGSLAVAARCFLEGLADKVRIEGWGADMVRGKLFSCRNQLLRQGMRWQIKLCQDDLVGAMLWGGSRFCGPKNMIIFQNIG